MGTEQVQQHPFFHLTKQQGLFCLLKEEKNSGQSLKRMMG